MFSNPTTEQIGEKIDSFREIANQAKGTYQRHEAEVRANSSLSPQGKQEQLTSIRASANEKISAADQAERTYLAEARTRLEKYLFGIGGTPTTEELVALRDATDRVDAIELSDHRKAADMFRRAAQVGDRTMMQALVTRAYNNGWGDVLDLYLEQHPGRQNEFAALQAINKVENNMQHVFLRGATYSMLR